MSSETSSHPNCANHLVSLSYASLPIFFFHKGSDKGLFFDKVIKQAQQSNGKENVFVLTDANFHLFSDYNCIDTSKFNYGSADFDKLYKHHSSNNYFFEKVCFDRWFIINAIVNDLQIDYFFHVDSDVLILEDLKPVYNDILKNKYDGTMMFFEDGLGSSITSGHSSFWSRKLINDFCAFVCRKYEDSTEFDILLKDATAGKFYNNTNLSDMILLDVFRTETKPATLSLLSLEERNICFDFNLNASYNGCKHSFEMRPFSKIKKINKRDDGWYGQVKGEDKLGLKFHTLHFQGYIIKTLIPNYVTSNGLYDSLQNYFNAKYFFFSRNLRMFKNRTRDLVNKLIGK
jgi:hypothetical protein